MRTAIHPFADAGDIPNSRFPVITDHRAIDPRRLDPEAE